VARELFLIAELLEQLDCLLHILARASDRHLHMENNLKSIQGPLETTGSALYRYLVRARIRFREFDGNSTALGHDALDEFTTSSDHGVMNLGWDGDVLNKITFISETN
jgi:hypothetical protein